MQVRARRADSNPILARMRDMFTKRQLKVLSLRCLFLACVQKEFSELVGIFRAQLDDANKVVLSLSILCVCARAHIRTHACLLLDISVRIGNPVDLG